MYWVCLWVSCVLALANGSWLARLMSAATQFKKLLFVLSIIRVHITALLQHTSTSAHNTTPPTTTQRNTMQHTTTPPHSTEVTDTPLFFLNKQCSSDNL